jgi:hypothetical protein
MKRLFLGFSMILFGMLSMNALIAAPVAAKCGDERFLTFPAWYRGLVEQNGASCNIKQPSGKDGVSKFIWTVGLNVVEILIQLVAYISVGYILWGGYTYIRTVSNSSNIARGREMIQNAIIGLIISLLAVILVSFVVGRISP